MAHTFRTPVASMTPQQREWFASAIVAMVLADGNVSQGEVESLMQSLGFVKNEQTVDKLKKFIQYQTVPQLGAFIGWDGQVKNRARMMLDLMDVAIADRDISPKERDQFLHIGRMLGFPQRKVEELIEFGTNAIAGMSDAQ